MTEFADPEEFSISSWLVPALIDGEYSGFDYNYDDEEENAEAVAKFERWVEASQSGRSGHWTADSDETSIEMCDVFGMPSECVEVVFLPIKKP